MKSIFNKIESLISNLLEYINTRIEILKLEAIEKISSVIASLIAGAVLGCFLVLFCIFASIALAFLVGEWVGSYWAGFLIIAGLYLLIGLIVWLSRERTIKGRIRNRLTREFFRQEQRSK